MPEVEVGGRAIPWTLRRSARARRLRIVVRSGRVEVVAPHRARRRAIDAFVAAQGEWIERKVAAWRERAVETLPERFESGGRVLFGGRSLALTVEPAEVDRAEVRGRGALSVRVPRALDGEGREAAAREAVIAWLRERVRADAEEMIERWAPELGKRPAALRIGSQKTLWGSCSARGVVSLNWRLAAAPRETLEYVVVHELCHLVERNHGPRFWALVERLLPDWRPRRDWLRRNGVPLE